MKLYELAASYFNSQKHPVTSHYASTANSCTRQLYYQWINEPVTNPPTVANYVKMAFGGSAEDIVERFLIHAIELGEIDAYQSQEKLHIKFANLVYPVAVKYDFVAYNNRVKYLVECKSSFGRKTRDIKKTGILPEEYLLQAKFYMKYFDINYMKLYYLSRDDGYMVEFNLLNWTKGIKYCEPGNNFKEAIIDLDQYIDKFRALEYNIETKTEPTRAYHLCVVEGNPQAQQIRGGVVVDKSDWQCFSYCKFRDKCWGIK